MEIQIITRVLMQAGTRNKDIWFPLERETLAASNAAWRHTQEERR